MNPTSPEKRERIIKLWFEDGKTGKEIAEIENTSEANVSAIINSVPKYFQTARDLAVKCRKNNKTLDNALKGVNIVLQIEALGLTTEGGQNLIEAFKKISTDTQYKPKQIICAYTKLAELEQQTGKQYPDALKHFEKLNLDIQELTQQIKTMNQQKTQLQNEITKNITLRAQTLKKAKVAENEITEFQETKNLLSQNGINLTDVEKLNKYLTTMKETGGDPKIFVTLAQDITSLSKERDQLKKQKTTAKNSIKKLKAKEETSRETVSKMQEEINTKKADLSQLEEMIKLYKIQKNALQMQIEELKNQRNAEISTLGKMLNMSDFEIIQYQKTSDANVLIEEFRKRVDEEIKRLLALLANARSKKR